MTGKFAHYLKGCGTNINDYCGDGLSRQFALCQLKAFFKVDDYSTNLFLKVAISNCRSEVKTTQLHCILKVSIT
ncbi:hypothetical protein ACFOOH_21355 [Planctobacterium marinum]